VSYLPFGPMSGYSWAQGGQSVLRTYDQNYALTDITGSALNLHFLRDAKSRIAAEGDTAGASPANESYQSDALDRLTQLTDATGATEQAFSYNLTGDRLSKTVAGQTTLSYGYQSGTHQLTLVGNASRGLDAAGNTTAMLTPNGTQVQLVYDDRNLLTQVQSGGGPIANYQYNGQGIRVWRTITAPSAGQAATVYDPLNTGNLYGEYFATDYREYVYLNGIPVASAMDAGRQAPAIKYLHADGLGTVRVATTTAGAVTDQWPWLNNAFGDKAMTGSSSYYLRFPGQYYDVETGLHYNGYRYYDPGAGRYVQSDPVGLSGGLSTYAYVGSSPLKYVDPYGLSSLIFDPLAHTLTVVNGEGQALEKFPAANNAQRSSRGPWPQGIYDYGYWVPHADGGVDGPYGSHGNNVFNVPGCSGCGVHSGRANSTDLAGRSGVNFATNGCIRTTDNATGLIRQLADAGDPLSGLTVTSNPPPTNLPPIDPSLHGGPVVYLPDTRP
jgi:RHS repeat-associated protein